MDITRIEQMVLASLRRCFGVKYQQLHGLHISNGWCDDRNECCLDGSKSRR